ncbi:MAG TPA: DUF1206 domain-containing protein [Ilumatobacteraceae bacterium]|nr:DUF1206 domain-containing protein [Ilumatobacteraceae bacterium]
MTTTLTTGGRRIAHTWRDPLGRAGIAARGVLYLVLGFLAIQFARGEVGSDQVNQAGAFETVAEQPFGKFLLVALTAGLAAMTLWRLVQAFVGDPVEGDEGKDRAEYFVKAVIYGFLTFTAAKITIDNWSGPAGSETASQSAGDAQQQQATSTLFDLPGGVWIVAGIGVILLVIAVWQGYEHVVNAEFMERIAPPSRMATAIEGFGRVGYAARSIVLAVSGIFFLVAAVQHDPSESKGISGSLQELAQHDWGRILLWITAIGLFLFGVFCLAEARYRRHS